ncbi:MAG: CDP-glucose 4,6-dehydratase [Bacillota bacterium]
MESLFNGVFKNKTVFVTGHTGFKGSWLALWLTALGARVVGYSLPPPTSPNMFESARIAGHITHITGDVRDAGRLMQAVQACEPDFVFHLAAQPLVRLSYQEPVLTYETNVMGTVNVLEAVRRTGSVRVCLVVTSDKCYDNKEWVYAYRENDSLGGRDPYSSSKACAEMAVAAYRGSFFSTSGGQAYKALSSVRAGNVIGGGDWAADRIVPDAVRALAKEEPVPVRNPHAVRPWQHVLEPLAGYLWLAARMWEDGPAYSSAWNFGPSSDGNVTVKELVEKIITVWGSGSWQDISGNIAQPHEATYLKLDCTKTNNLLCWYPVYNVTEAVAATVDWYREYYSNKEANLFSITLKQIADYVEKARRSRAVWA